MQITYIILEATSNCFLPFLPRVIMEQKGLLRYSACKTPTVSPTVLENERSIFLLQIYHTKHWRSAHMAFVGINHIPCLTEKIEHKFQKICWGRVGGENHSTEKWENTESLKGYKK